VTVEGSVFPYRDLILFLAFALILFTLVIQVPTLPLLVRRVRMMGDMGSGEETLARVAAAKAALDEIERIAESASLPNAELERLRTEFIEHLSAAQGEGDGGAGLNLHKGTLASARLRIIESGAKRAADIMAQQTNQR